MQTEQKCAVKIPARGGVCLGLGMPHMSGHDGSQTLLLPESVDDYFGPENPVRFIDAFVDGLDLAAAGFTRVAPNSTGRPGYARASWDEICRSRLEHRRNAP